MEPFVMPLHSSTPPPLDDYGDGEAGSDEDVFGDFGGFSVGVPCSGLGFTDSTEPPSTHRQPCSTSKPATYQPKYSFNHPVEQSQPVSTENSGSGQSEEHVDYSAEPSLHLTNGYAEGDHISEAQSVSTPSQCSPKEEMGFADFTVFSDQAGHPWCCGFSPLGGSQQWAGGVEGTNSAEQSCDPGCEVIMDSEPRSHCVYKAKENICTVVENTEKRDAALVQPSQDHHQPQEAPVDQPHLQEECGVEHGDRWRERRRSSNSSQSSEVQDDGEKTVSAVPQAVSVYESVSEDLASVCDDSSFEGASADLEPNVSSLASQADQTEGQTDDDCDDEELENCRCLDSFDNSRMANLCQSEAEEGFHRCDQSATQETSTTSNLSSSVTHREDKCADTDATSEPHGDQDHVQTADVRVQSLGSLPPSDSFADFCSAPTQQDEDGSWAEFQDPGAQEEETNWTQVRDQVSSLQSDGSTDECMGALRKNSCQALLSCRIQQLLWASFPEVVVSAVEEEEVLSLGAFLHGRHVPESEEVEEQMTPELSAAQRVQWGLWWPHKDVHSAVGFQFQWGGSHTNRSLLRCLGIDTRNIVFIGMKKQPIAVPAFASSLGMLEPTKDSVPAVCSPGHTAVTAKAPPGPRISSTDSQESLPSRQLDWSSRGLSSSQDGTSPCRVPHFWGRK